MERREELSFREKARDGGTAIEWCVAYDLQRNALLKRRVIAFGQIHDAHSAATDLALDAVGADVSWRRHGGGR